jgi:hypothetical protein
VLLPEIGVRGQERLHASTAEVAGSSLAHEVAMLYAERAGFGAVAPGSIDVGALAPISIAEHAAPRAVLAGSRAALAAIRASVRGS